MEESKSGVKACASPIDYGARLKKIHRPAGSGPFRRAILVRRINENSSYGWVEDDFHHFGVALEHRAGRIIRVSAEARRAPWNTCPGAALSLRALEGAQLLERASDIGLLINMRQQCTHMFDLAGLVMAHIARGEAGRFYEVEVARRNVVFAREGIRQTGFASSKLYCDDGLAMVLDVEGDDIVGPGDYAGHSLNQGFRAWTESLPLEEAEHAFILRRALMVANGRHIDLDLIETAAEAPMPPVCYTFSIPDLTCVHRAHGTTRDFAHARDKLLKLRNEPPPTD